MFNAMHISLLAIQLVPHYALIAGVVILAHWVWLFGFKNRNTPAARLSPSVQGNRSEASPSSSAVTIEPSFYPSEENQEENPFDQEDEPANESDFSSLTTDDSADQVTNETEYFQKDPDAFDIDQANDSALMTKYAGRDILPALRAMRFGELPAPTKQELVELSALTLATEQEIPYAIDLV